MIYSKYFLMVLCVFSLSSYADYASFSKAKKTNCDYFKEDVLKSKQADQAQLSKLESEIKKDNFCYQNLMGIMIYKGIHFKKDEIKAKKIFYQLAEKNYPEAQFNFAWTLTKDYNQDPLEVMQFLTGIFISYHNEHGSKHIAEKSVFLARKYLDNYLLAQPQICSHEKCSENFTEHNEDSINKIRQEFDKLVASNVHEYMTARRTEHIAFKKNEETVMFILSLGALAYTATVPSSAPSTYNSTQSGSEWFKNGINWNPLNLNQFPR